MSAQGLLARSLDDALTSVDGVRTTFRKASPTSQDAGTLLTIVLSAPALLAAIHAIAKWAIRENQGIVDIKKGKVHVQARGVDSKELVRALEAALKD